MQTVQSTHKAIAQCFFLLHYVKVKARSIRFCVSSLLCYYAKRHSHTLHHHPSVITQSPSLFHAHHTYGLVTYCAVLSYCIGTVQAHKAPYFSGSSSEESKHLFPNVTVTVPEASMMCSRIPGISWNSSTPPPPPITGLCPTTCLSTPLPRVLFSPKFRLHNSKIVLKKWHDKRNNSN
jgi:hypothetical protein